MRGSITLALGRIIALAALLAAAPAQADCTLHPCVELSVSSSGVANVTGSFNTTSPSAAFTPVAGRAFKMRLTGALPASLALKCSVDGGSNYDPIVVENTQLYQPTLAGQWEYETSAYGTMCHWEWTGTAAGAFVFAQ